MEREHVGGARSADYRSYFCAVILLVMGLLIYLWGHVKTMDQGEKLERLREERQALIRQQDRLRAEVAGLNRSSRIREIASKELGMVFPSEAPRNLCRKNAPLQTDVGLK